MLLVVLLCETLVEKAAVPSHLALRAAAALESGSVYVDRGFLTSSDLSECREAVATLNTRCASNPGEVGRADGRRLDTQQRASSVLDLNSDRVWPFIPAPLLRTLREVESLRLGLACATSRPLMDDVELQLLTYARGGLYARHVDDVQTPAATATNQCRRSISMLLYLTAQDWRETDGGQLRIHAMGTQAACVHEYLSGAMARAAVEGHGDGYSTRTDGMRVLRSTTSLDVLPTGGTIVIFDSTTVPHEVMPTSRARSVLAAWLLERRERDPAPCENAPLTRVMRDYARLRPE